MWVHVLVLETERLVSCLSGVRTILSQTWVSVSYTREVGLQGQLKTGGLLIASTDWTREVYQGLDAETALHWRAQADGVTQVSRGVWRTVIVAG